MGPWIRFAGISSILLILSVSVFAIISFRHPSTVVGGLLQIADSRPERVFLSTTYTLYPHFLSRFHARMDAVTLVGTSGVSPDRLCLSKGAFENSPDFEWNADKTELHSTKPPTLSPFLPLCEIVPVIYDTVVCPLNAAKYQFGVICGTQGQIEVGLSKEGLPLEYARHASCGASRPMSQGTHCVVFIQPSNGDESSDDAEDLP